MTYGGYDSGTHSVMRAPWSELDLYEESIDEYEENCPIHDKLADKWISETVFSETAFGVCRGFAISGALQVRKYFRDIRR